MDDLILVCATYSSSLVFYYCDYTQPGSLQPSQVLGSILKQLLLKGVLCQETEEHLAQACNSNASTPDQEDLASILYKTIDSGCNVHIILDGLDECEKDAKQFLTNVLRRLMSFQNANCRVLYTCRDEDQMLRALDEYPQIHMSSRMSFADIKSYVEWAVKSRLQSRDLAISDPDLEEEIVTELVNKSQGM